MVAPHRTRGAAGRPGLDSGGSAGAPVRAATPTRLSRRPMPDQTQTNGRKGVGKLLEIKGVVVDAVFTGGLPEINTALEIDIPGRDGEEPRRLVAEVQQHLGDDRVRAVAMDSTDGLARGVEVRDTGVPISVPVGNGTLGRLFNVLGDTIDERGPAETDERWPIHRDAPSFESLQ